MCAKNNMYSRVPMLEYVQKKLFFCKKKIQLFCGMSTSQQQPFALLLWSKKSLTMVSTFSIRIDIVTARKGQTPCHIFQEKDTEDTLFKIPKNVDSVKYVPVFFDSQFRHRVNKCRYYQSNHGTFFDLVTFKHDFYI